MYNRCAEDSTPPPDQHLAKYLRFLIDTSQWPIPTKQLSRIMEVQDQMMEENILKKSNFVVKDAFDLGLRSYYSQVSSAVSGILKSRGYTIKENSDLLREKENLTRTKKQMVRARLKSMAVLTSNKLPSYSSTAATSGMQTPHRLPSVSPQHHSRHSSSHLKPTRTPSHAYLYRKKKHLRGYT